MIAMNILIKKPQQDKDFYYRNKSYKTTTNHILLKVLSRYQQHVQRKDTNQEKRRGSHVVLPLPQRFDASLWTSNRGLN